MSKEEEAVRSSVFITLAIVLGAFALTIAAPPAAAQADTDGCHDGALARLPNFYINECDPAGSDHYVFAEGTAAQRDIQGTKTRIAYAIKEGASAPSVASILSSYTAQLQQNGWTVVASGDARWITAYRGSASGQWAQVEANGGENYQVVYVTPSGTVAASNGPAHAYVLSCDGVTVGTFTRAEGLDLDLSMPEYRNDAPNYVRRIIPAKAQNITLSGGSLAQRTGQPTTGPIARTPASKLAGPPRQQCQIVLTGTDGAPLVTWQLRNTRTETLSGERGSAAVRLEHEGISINEGVP
jgi:hypothetical protein